MRQKYVISRDASRNKLTIGEYAVIDKHLNKKASSLLMDGDYLCLYVETYTSDAIKHSMSQGMDALIAILRTKNMFPVEQNAIKIAESVMALYNSSQNEPVELFFDDSDSLSS